MRFVRMLKKYFLVAVFFFFLSPAAIALSSTNEQDPSMNYKQQIAELDVTIARLIEQKKNLEKKVNELEETSAQSNPQTWKDPLLGIDFVWIPKGCFQMGDRLNAGDQDERPAHKVCLDGFYMGQFEVTQTQYVKIMRKNPSAMKAGNSYPVELVSWKAVHVFLSRLNKLSQKNMRLPTEAEWEYAARSGNKRYKFAGSDSANEVAWSQLNDASIINKVGLKKPNDFGLYDMSGNVSEWCSDWYSSSYYSQSDFNNPAGPNSGSHKVFRGGHFQSFSTQLRVSNRGKGTPHIKLPFVGFRLAFTP